MRASISDQRRLSAWAGAAALAAWTSIGACQTPATARPESGDSPLTEALSLCVQEHESGRLYKTELRFFEARRALTRCASLDCPLAVRADCQNWLAEVEALVPTVVVVLEGEPPGRTLVRMTIDGLATEQNLGGPIELAPGEHRLRFELPPYAPVEQLVELSPGEKNRVVRVRFADSPRVPAASLQSSARPPADVGQIPGGPALAQTRPIPTVTYVLGASAAVSAAAAGILLVSALIDQDRAKERCAPFCAPELLDSIDRRLLFADLAGAGALLLGGLTTYSYLTRPTETKVVGQRRVSLQLRATGASVTLGGEF
jgi:hypothetical protein